MQSLCTIFEQTDHTVYITPFAELRLQQDMLLKIVRPLYGVPEIGLHWYLTYIEHLESTLGMGRTSADSCVLVRRTEEELEREREREIILQVDDILGIGTHKFLNDERSAANQFKCKPRTHLTHKTLLFNGSQLDHPDDRTIRMWQPDKIGKTQHAKDQPSFASQRAMAQYIGVNTRPDICSPVQLIAPDADPFTPGDFKCLTKVIKHLTTTTPTGLQFTALDLPAAPILVFADFFFANAKDHSSQLAFFILMADVEGSGNIVQYGSPRCRRVMRSVMASAEQALISGFENEFSIRDMLEHVIARLVPI